MTRIKPGIKIIFVLAFLFTLIRCASPPPPDFDEEEWLQRTGAVDDALLYAAHVNPGGTFFNPWLQRQPRKKRETWRRGGPTREYDSFPNEQYSSVLNDYAYISDNDFYGISYTGHASFIIKMDGETIFTDPFFSNSALIIRKEVKIKFDFSKVPRRPVVLISHNHHDHLDKYSVKKLIKKDAVFIVPLGLKNLIEKWGAKEVHELDWWESISLDPPVRVTLLPAQHWSRRLGQKAGTTLWGGFLIEGSKTIYFSGDTGYFIGFKEFGRLYNIDYALLAAGAYEPRWFMHYSHTNVEEFFRAVDDIGAQTAIPFHFGVINLSEEPLLYPLYEIEKYMEQHPEYSGMIQPLRVGECLKMFLPDFFHTGD